MGPKQAVQSGVITPSLMKRYDYNYICIDVVSDFTDLLYFL
jgi:hypothetical protein